MAGHSNPTQAVRRLMAPTRVLVVDDHPLFRDALQEILQKEPAMEICGEAAEENQALEQVRATHPDFVTVDISLASGNGLDLVKRIKRIAPETLMLVLSMHDECTYAARALGAGALGYVSKQAPTEEILQAIRAVRSGRIYLSDEMTQRLLLRSLGSRLPPGSTALDLLSDRELEVFRQIGLGYSTKQIAGKLGLATTTIETYRERLKTKLNLSNSNELRQQATHWVIQDH